jgi:RNA polymerase sigma-70 factor (TIGR02943 family)
MNNYPPQSAIISSAAIEKLIADEDYLLQIRQQMLKFATLQLDDANHAEDAVQEALIGAFKNVRSFGGRAAFKTWIFAILKNKIADIIRQKKRLNETGLLVYPDRDLQPLDEPCNNNLFNGRGFWNHDERPAKWGNPEADMENHFFWRIFDSCLNHLPGHQVRVFMMREFIELDTKEICETVGITETNLHVLLYRARLRLRECLEHHWFLKGAHHV